MIPAAYAANTVSNAEKKVFSWLKNDPNTSEWTVLHSLNLSINAGRRYGEIDFVVLIPGIGIVCLEVKGGGVKCEDGVWSSTGADGLAHALKRSPFAQARANMFTLRERILAQFGSRHVAPSLPTGFIAVFPDCLSPPESPEFTRAEVIDCEDLRYSIASAILKFAAAKLGFPGSAGAGATPAVIKELRTFLRPDFDRAVARSATIGTSEEKILEFTQEQIARLEELDENRQCLFEGPAGTGKTLLALHLAKIKAAEGKRVLLICYNKLLGRWLVKQTEDNPRLRAGSFFSILRRMILLSEFAQEYMAKERSLGSGSLLHLLGEYGHLAILQFNEKYDVLIVDEVQDLATDVALTVFDDWVHGGLADGEWAFFGDFTRQSIFDSKGDGYKLLSGRTRAFTKSKLLNNCRNTRQIAEAAVTLSGFSSFPYRTSIADGAPVQYHYWKDRAEQVSLLEESITRYRSENISLSDIVLLSPYKLENSGLQSISVLDGIRISDVTETDFNEDDSTVIKFCTVQAFKGMESAIIFYIDVESIGAEQQPLIYVGLSRARAALHVFVHKANRSKISDLFNTMKLLSDSK